MSLIFKRSRSTLAMSAKIMLRWGRLAGLQSKRPQVKTSPSQNVPELVKTSPKISQNVPMVKHVGQNVPKMLFILYFGNFRHNLGCLNETVLDKVFVFLSRFHSVISVNAVFLTILLYTIISIYSLALVICVVVIIRQSL